MGLTKELELVGSGVKYKYHKLLGSKINFVHGSSVIMHGFSDKTVRNRKDGQPVHGSQHEFPLTKEENMELKELIGEFMYDKAMKQEKYKNAKKA